MRILVAIQGHYGQRIADNIRQHCPAEWEAYTYSFSSDLPAIVDDANEFLPKELPAADLLISLGEHPGVAQMIPDMVKKSGAKAVIAPADNRVWLPPGLARQIKRKLESMGVEVVYPVPFCTLAEKDSQNQYIREFAKYFGRPEIDIELDRDRIKRVAVIRGAPCGCSPYVADGLAGVWERDAVEKAGLLHHQYPCLATMVMDQQFEDTLMHRAGLMTKLAVEKAIKGVKVAK
ncbi:MAG: thymidylate synthase [Chloroflexi bacterium]|nr:thymidylate synthase [Chloroflexota bacterium]MBL7061482.1 thymidylate synthase [Dehalococcoidia bacterium]